MTREKLNLRFHASLTQRYKRAKRSGRRPFSFQWHGGFAMFDPAAFHKEMSALSLALAA